MDLDQNFLISYSLPVPARLRHSGGRSGGLIRYFTLKIFIILLSSFS
jgi:hypothetical protein